MVSSIVYRDWFLTVDMKEGKVVDTPEERVDVEANKNEVMLLLGLAVQSLPEHGCCQRAISLPRRLIACFASSMINY